MKKFHEVYNEARQAVIGKIDYWNEKENPALFSAFQICQQLACENYGKAYYLLSMLYSAKQDGEGTQDRAHHFEKLAFDWCLTNLDRDDVELWRDLGDLYQQLDVENNFEQSVFWFSKAAEQGYAEAQYDLSYAYRFGLGVPENLADSMKWCQAAANQGHEIATANLVYVREEAVRS